MGGSTLERTKLPNVIIVLIKRRSILDIHEEALGACEGGSAGKGACHPDLTTEFNPGTHLKKWKERMDSGVVLRPPDALRGLCTCAHSHTQ